MTLNAVTIRAPDSRTVFDNLSLGFGRERTALVGRNGAGKTCLFRLMAGEIDPLEGRVVRHGSIGLLHQDYWPRPDETLAQTLGVAERLAVLARLLAGEGTAEDMAEADWYLEARLDQVLRDLGLQDLSLERLSQSLSGGELTRLRLAGLLLDAPDVLLLDEPTNHLDAEARAYVYRLIERWPAGLAVISHDRDLLRRVDRIIELSGHGARLYGGNWDHYLVQRDLERAAAEHEQALAQKALAQAGREAQAAVERQSRRDSVGRSKRASSSDPKIMLDFQAQRAEESTGRHARLAHRQQTQLTERLKAAEARIERHEAIDMDLPMPVLPEGRMVLDMEGVVWRALNGDPVLGPLDLRLTGPRRWAVTGRNGSGKSSLLKLMSGELMPTEGRIARPVACARLDQATGNLVSEESLIEAWRRHSPRATPHQAHAALARFGFRNRAALRRVCELSGGERLRLALACVLLSEGAQAEPVGLLLLDEPTNHLDLEAVEALEQVLKAYRGALVVVSHDRDFLNAIGVEEEIRL